MLSTLDRAASTLVQTGHGRAGRLEGLRLRALIDALLDRKSVSRRVNLPLPHRVSPASASGAHSYGVVLIFIFIGHGTVWHDALSDSK